MNISNYYWYFESAIPPRICDLIVKYGKAEKQREIMAITGGFGRDRDLNKQPLNKDEIKDLQKKRDSNIIWMNDRWIYKEIQPYIHQANKMQVGILTGIFQNLVSLLYIKKVNIMIGIVIVGINLIWKKDPQKERLENYL
jgi:hypothetical protein